MKEKYEKLAIVHSKSCSQKCFCFNVHNSVDMCTRIKCVNKRLKENGNYCKLLNEYFVNITKPPLKYLNCFKKLFECALFSKNLNHTNCVVLNYSGELGKVGKE